MDKIDGSLLRGCFVEVDQRVVERMSFVQDIRKWEVLLWEFKDIFRGAFIKSVAGVKPQL